ncbi:hypothetical protein GX48_05899 [Paracoccidioides brasiliensis]|nr:hypothetical protein GX48_05899 [Paracoccidioides brasiliensis]
MDHTKRDASNFHRLISTFKSPIKSSPSSASISSSSPVSLNLSKPFIVPMPNSQWKKQPVQQTPTSNSSGDNSSSVAAAEGSRTLMRWGQQQLHPLGLLGRKKLSSQDRDLDLTFDAFDRELLAQLERGVERGEERQHDVPDAYGQEDESEDLYGPTLAPMPPKNSKFFQSSTNATSTTMSTPFRNQVSSSSEVGLFSSPSLAVKARKRPPPLFSKDGVHDDDQELGKSSFSPQTISSPELQTRAALSFSPLKSHEIQLDHALPMIQGIRLVSTHELPDRFRSIFPFPIFNAIQSKSFRSIYQGDDNFVLSAPTGSGKTVVMELAICRLVTNFKNCRFKVVYQAPTKSLCSERFRDWQTKFTSLDLQCAELTGDTDHAQLRCVQNANIIITTPEKWDSMTRKWKDHIKLMQLVKLFLIDEVHILKEARGATLEAVVSRMKSLDSNVRFVALSATVPNSEDIAAWLGKDPTNQHLPAHRERFSEEFRPVKLQKFVYGYQSNGNDFAFDKFCEARLPEVIEKHSQKKPIMIFCCTRNSSIATSKYLAKLWTSTNPPNRLWSGPTKPLGVQNPELRATISSGVAFHHAGVDANDRHAVENGFLSGQINVICCTSTLAVGVNLPCHLVIIKNTVSWQEAGCKEYADLEMMQMLGRAGRPQFDDSAVAVILTRKERVNHYEKLVSGTESLESCLHLNLIDHLNAAIGLGTIKDVESATRWLAGTFFFIRLRQNPGHYNLKEGANRSDEEEMLKEICEENIKRLQECSLVTDEEPLKSTAFGDAMARYYIKFETMKLCLSLPPKAKMSEILSVVAQAEEFREIRLKSGEKSLYKELNKGNGIKFPIKIDIALPAHKISLLIQSELGSVDIPTGDQYQKHKMSFQQDKGFVFSHANRLIRCIIDCQISLQDSVGTRHALELARGIGARVWDNSALQMKQIDQIGIVAVRKLANAGINTLEALETTEPHRIEMLLSKNPPFGSRILAKLAEFPKPRVSLKLVRKDIKHGETVRIGFKAEIGFINEKIPIFFRRKPVYVCFLAETSDGRMIDFRRISAIKLQNGHDILLSAELTDIFQYISCYVMCDDIAGTMRQAELRHDIPASCFPTKISEIPGDGAAAKQTMNTSRRRRSENFRNRVETRKDVDEFEDDSLDDIDLIAAAKGIDYNSLDEFNGNYDLPKTTSLPNQKAAPGSNVKDLHANEPKEPVRFENGNWACNHRCKDKTREGIDRPPKPNKRQDLPASNVQQGKTNKTSKESRNFSEWTKSENPHPAREQNKNKNVEIVDLCVDDNKSSKLAATKSHSKGDKSFHKQKRIEDCSGKTGPHEKISYSLSKGISLDLSFFDDDGFEGPKTPFRKKEASSDYGNSWVDDLPSPNTLLGTPLRKRKVTKSNEKFNIFEDGDEYIPFHPLQNGDDKYMKTISPMVLNKTDTMLSFPDDANNKPASSPEKGSMVSNPFLPSSVVKQPTMGTNSSFTTRTVSTPLFPLPDPNPIIIGNGNDDNVDSDFMNDQNFFKGKKRKDGFNCTSRTYHADNNGSDDNAMMVNDYGYDVVNKIPHKRSKYSPAESEQPIDASFSINFGDIPTMVDKPPAAGDEPGFQELEKQSNRPGSLEGLDTSLLEEFKDLVNFF